MTFFSAQALHPRVADLSGLLCGPGQAVGFGRGTAARVSVVVDDEWRARALAAECSQRGVHVELGRSEGGRPLLRSAFRADLASLARRWTRGAVKSVPEGFIPDGPALRIWALAAGTREGSGYAFGLDPHATETHEPLLGALHSAGLPASLLGLRRGEPSLRITGKRRLERLAELVGPITEAVPIPESVVEQTWPLAS